MPRDLLKDEDLDVVFTKLLNGSLQLGLKDLFRGGVIWFSKGYVWGEETGEFNGVGVPASDKDDCRDAFLLKSGEDGIVVSGHVFFNRLAVDSKNGRDSTLAGVEDVGVVGLAKLSEDRKSCFGMAVSPNHDSGFTVA